MEQKDDLMRPDAPGERIALTPLGEKMLESARSEKQEPLNIKPLCRACRGTGIEPQPAAEYARKNPLGGPANVFLAMASRVRAGENFYEVLDDYGLQYIKGASSATRPKWEDCRRCGAAILTTHPQADPEVVAGQNAAEAAEPVASPEYDYAKALATFLHKRHYAHVKDWKPLTSTIGVLTQIDNMLSGLQKAAPP